MSTRGSRALVNAFPVRSHPIEDVLVLEGLERRETRHHRQLVRTEGRRVHHGTIHGAVDGVGHRGRAQHGAHRHVPARECFGERDDVRADPELLVAKEGPGSAHAGLDLVEHQQRLVSPAERLRLGPELVRGHVDPLALDRFDDEGGHVTPPQLPGQGVRVAEGDHVAPGKQRSEPAAEFASSVQRQGTGGEPVKGVVAVEDPRTLRGGPGELDGSSRSPRRPNW